MKKVSGYSNRYKLSVATTYNPGVTYLNWAVKYDDSCTLLSNLTDNSGNFIIINNDDDNVVGMSYTGTQDYDGLMYVDLYFRISGSTSIDHEFTVGVYNYWSQTENKKSNGSLLASVANDAVFGVREGMVGDLDGDDGIDMDDAYLAKLILNKVNKTSISTNALNAYLKKPDNRATLISQGQFLGLVNDAYVSAAVADADGNNVIDLEDSVEITSYYTHASVGSTYLSDYLGKAPTVKVVC